MASSLRDYSPKVDIAMCVLCLVLGIMSFVMGWNSKRSEEKLKAECTQSTSAVAASPVSRSGSGKIPDTMYRATITYIHEETKQIVTIKLPWSSTKFYEGESLNIRYSPDDPTKIYVEGRESYDEKHAKRDMIFGPLLVLLSVIMFLGYPARKRKYGI